MNEALREFFRDSPSSITTRQLEGTLADRLRKHRATRYFYENYHLNGNLDYLVKSKKELVKTAMEVWISGLASNHSVGQIIRDAKGAAPLLVRLLAMPPGLAAYYYLRATS